MIVSIVPIGNSKGIRLPKAILEQLHIVDTVELEVDNQQIILKPVHLSPRKGWREAFTKMLEREEDSMLIPEDTDSGAFTWEW